MRTPLTVYRSTGSHTEAFFPINFMARMFVKNLKPYALVAYSYNDNFKSISFEPEEMKDCSGIQINTKNNFQLFVKTYIVTNILSLIPIYDDIYVPVVLEDGYFDFAYVDYDWVE
jgi:hypothetical protein